MSHIMALDCSFHGMSLLVGNDNKQGARPEWSYESHIYGRRGTAEGFNEMWQAACEELPDLSPQKISKIVVGVGPGSFTGIRIALSWAAGFSFGLAEVVWLQINSLELACQALAKTTSCPTALFLQGTRDYGYLACSSKSGDNEKTLPFKFDPNLEDIAEAASEFLQGQGVWVSPGQVVTVVDTTKVDTALEKQPHLISQDRLGGLFSSALSDKIANNPVWKTGQPEANYMRLSTAEENLLGQK